MFSFSSKLPEAAHHHCEGEERISVATHPFELPLDTVLVSPNQSPPQCNQTNVTRNDNHLAAQCELSGGDGENVPSSPSNHRGGGVDHHCTPLKRRRAPHHQTHAVDHPLAPEVSGAAVPSLAPPALTAADAILSCSEGPLSIAESHASHDDASIGAPAAAAGTVSGGRIVVLDAASGSPTSTSFGHQHAAAQQQHGSPRHNFSNYIPLSPATQNGRPVAAGNESFSASVSPATRHLATPMATPTTTSMTGPNGRSRAAGAASKYQQHRIATTMSESSSRKSSRHRHVRIPPEQEDNSTNTAERVAAVAGPAFVVPTAVYTKLRSSMSLAFVLVLQCLSVAGAFVVLIVVTSLMMDSTARALVEEGVAAELHYARARILAPINMYEKLLLSLRYNYMARKLLTGEDPCAESPNLADSAPFFIDSSAIIEKNPMLSYVYHLRRSELHNYSNTTERQIVECDATPNTIMLIGALNVFTNRSVHLDDFANITAAFTPEIDDSDYFDDDYVWQAFSYTSFHWVPYVYWDPRTDVTDLVVAATAPMTIRRTYEDGSSDTYVPVLEVDGDALSATESAAQRVTNESSPQVIATEVLSTMSLEVSMSAFATLMRSVTPDDAGATTSLYDLSPDRARPSLVCTSVEGMRVFDSATEQEWPAGQTPSEAINRAYRIARPTPTRAASSSGTVVTLSEDFAKGDIVARIAYEDGYVVSTIPIETSSGITFAVVQATPEAYYLSTVWQLRTVMIAIGVVAAVFVVVVCVAIGVSIVVPLRKMQANMQLASSFKNEHVVPTSSFLSEIDLLCLSLDRMNAKLLQARAFMPQALLTSSGEDEEGDANDHRARGDHEDDDDAENRHVVDLFEKTNASSSLHDMPVFMDTSTKFSHHTAGGGAGADHAESTATYLTDNSNTTDTSYTIGSSVSPARGGGGAARGKVPTQTPSSGTRRRLRQHQLLSILKKGVSGGGGALPAGVTELVAVGSSNASMVNKRVTVLAVNARGFHAKVSLSAPSTITALAADLTGLVVSVCAAERGVVDAFHGDHFVLTFNAAKHNAQGPTAAMRCARELIRRAEEAHVANTSFSGIHQSGGGFSTSQLLTSQNAVGSGYDRAEGPLHDSKAFFSMGASTGRACVGHLGTASMKRQSIVGKCYSKAMALEGLCRRIGSLAGTDDGSPPIQCLIDGPLATEVKHLYLLQLLGALCHAPFVDPTTTPLSTSKLKVSAAGTSNTTTNSTRRAMERIYALRDIIPDGNAASAAAAADASIVNNAASRSVNNSLLVDATVPEGADGSPLARDTAMMMLMGGDAMGMGMGGGLGGGGLGINDGEWLYETQRAAQQDPLLVNINECYGSYLKELMAQGTDPAAGAAQLRIRFAQSIASIASEYRVSDLLRTVTRSDDAESSFEPNSLFAPPSPSSPYFWGTVALFHIHRTVLDDKSNRRVVLERDVVSYV